MRVADWAAELAAGCAASPSGRDNNDRGSGEPSKSCARLLQQGGSAMAGALVDFVADGSDAAEWTMDAFDFQAALCTTYGKLPFLNLFI
jgi:hypothetical protein